MKKIIYGMICFLAILMFESMGEFAQGTETQTIELKPVMEYKCDEPIVDVIFGEAEMTVKEAMALGMKGLEQKKETEKVKVQYPKVVVTEKAIQTLDEKGTALDESGRVKFLDENGKVKREEVLAPYGDVILSKKGNYVGITKSINVTEKGPESIEFRLMDDEGKTLWKSNEGLMVKM
ncbi:MAG: hypothetical protein ABIB46_01005 [bacterium]